MATTPSWGCARALPAGAVSTRRGPWCGIIAARRWGKAPQHRLELIERNRLLLALKLFPWSLLWLNPVFFAVRVAASVAAAGREEGDTAHFPGLAGKWRMARAILRGDWGALRLAPRMLRKRAGMRRLRRLSPAEVRRLLLRHRLSLRHVA